MYCKPRNEDVVIMTIEEKEEFVKEQYKLLRKDKHKHNYQILYNLIAVKVKFQLCDIQQSLYLDVKQFIEWYITSADSQDYGYDEVLLVKIMDVVHHLEPKQKVSIMYLTKRMFYIRGYEVENITKIINHLEMIVALEEKRFGKAIRLWMSSSLTALLLTLLLYVIIISCAMIPAPLEFMEIFNISLKNYSDSPFLNHLMNSVAVLTGNDEISPSITPIGIKGIMVYSIGVLLYYLIIANYALKKIENYITIK